jgi:DNA polymerase (family 10)
MKKSPDVKEIYFLGSLRRRRDTIGDVDLAVASNNPKEVIEHFVNYPHKERVLEQGPSTAGLLVSGTKHIDLMVQPPERFGSLLQHFTGSKNHNVHLRELALKKGLSVSEYGIKEQKTGKTILCKTEQDVYKTLGMDWIPPEIREDAGEIELAIKHELPTLVALEDIKADFHLHSAFPIEPSHDMGVDTMETMIEKAKSLGYSYIGFSEHNPSVSKHSKEEVVALMEKRYKKIEQLNLKYNKSIHILSLLETDIQPDGSLAIPEEAMQYLDATLVSIHSVFSMDKETMTARVLKGLSHPKAKILTHPSGRLINQRPGYELDWTKLFTFAKEHNKAIEINAFPSRLDLVDHLVREAVTIGVKLVIDTDSHAVDQMDLMQFGVSVARRGWATRHDILNTLEYNEFTAWLNS